MNEEIVNFLNTLGCCQRCVLLFFCVQKVEAYYDASSIQKAITGILSQQTSKCDVKFINSITDMAITSCFRNTKLCKETEEMSAAVKRQKLNTCVTCLGLFQWACSVEAQNMMVDAIKAGDYDCPNFSIMVTLPLSITFRVQRVWEELLQLFPNFPSDHCTSSLDLMKNIWCSINGPLVASQVGKAFLHGKQVYLALDVTANYPDDAKDCSVLDKLCHQSTPDKQKQHSYSVDHFKSSRGNVPNQFQYESGLLDIFPERLLVPESSISLGKMHCYHTPFYIAGRYNKFSRHLSQTPVMVRGERSTSSSVQEIICGILIKAVKADNVKFLATGSEEAEVRCLGKGRPFVIEFLDPHIINFEKEKLVKLQEKINKTTNMISVRDLQIITRKQNRNEEEKVKYHIALCCIREGFDSNELGILNQMREINIHQKTPLIALHRQPLTTKLFKLHQVSAFPVNQHFFKLHVSSDAGLEMRELINGDMGRTVPSVASILGKTVTLVAMDIEDVDLDWPPKVESRT